MKVAAETAVGTSICAILAEDVFAMAVQHAFEADSSKASTHAAFGLDGLHGEAAKKKMFFGSATSEDRIISDIPYRTALVKECGIIVPEYEMKWDIMRPSATTYNFADADFMINFARQNGLAVRGHTLCWHRALPSWFASTVNSRNAAQFLTEHIATVCGRYKGRIHSWDVVNEAIEPTDRQTNGLRNSPWFQLLGESYIETAFRAAHQADPAAILVYNEYGVEFDDTIRTDAIVNLLRRLKARNVPLHALGVQGHIRAADKAKFAANMQRFRTFLREVATLGLSIIITELDCDDTGLASSITTRDEGVGGMYGDYCSVVMNEPAVIGIITWGLTDKYTALNSTNPRSDRLPQRPLPLDANMVRKNAWYALEYWFKNTMQRPRQTITSVAEERVAPIQRLRCIPNTQQSECEIQFTLERSEDVLLRLVDVRGQDVQILAQARFEAGEHRFMLNYAAFPIGTYLCILQSPSFLVSEKILLQK